MGFLSLNVTFFCLICCYIGKMCVHLCVQNKILIMRTDRIDIRINKLLKVEITKKLHKYGFNSLSGLIIYLLTNWNEQNK